MKFGGHTKFVACRKSKLGRKNSDPDRTKDCMAFQCNCIEIDLDTKPELNRTRRHLGCAKSYADESDAEGSDAGESDADGSDAGGSDCMNAETCRNSELDCLIFETCRNSELELDRMRSDPGMKFEFDCMRPDPEMKSELDRTKSELDGMNSSCNCRSL